MIHKHMSGCPVVTVWMTFMYIGTPTLWLTEFPVKEAMSLRVLKTCGIVSALGLNMVGWLLLLFYNSQTWGVLAGIPVKAIHICECNLNP